MLYVLFDQVCRLNPKMELRQAAAQLVDAFMTFSPNANPMTISVT
jgi:hypothetical protein